MTCRMTEEDWHSRDRVPRVATLLINPSGWTPLAGNWRNCVARYSILKKSFAKDNI